MLTPAAYDRAELLAEQGLPNRLIQACRPALFNHIGYPARATSSGALWRWADAMHEGRFESDFENMLGGLSEQEWAWWRAIMRCARNLTNGRPVVPTSALARATISLRAIKARAKAPALIVEIGPGSGYLTALLGLAGYAVYAVEVAQAFYLWQARLYEALLGARYVDMVHLNQPEHSGCVVHVPWWHFYRLDTAPLDTLPVELAVASHVLCEMHKDAVAYLARLCGDNWLAPLLLDEYGKDLLGAQGEVQRTLARWAVAFTSIDPAAARPTPRPIKLAAVLAFRDELMGAPTAGTTDELWWRMLHGPGHHG